ncbi:2-amino-4-hydroxy-6-hydroxymethyldihydropteridine diphosphokinase [Hoylesella timonensis]|uniref:2-amino-4-hydroxy-6-hydroxymethyldihydropteridine pyrophosphokinase n=1 Tax=Hoylesella timonensis S9-PR14 TaxID=1401062 RepID=A0A098YUQ6_9BACT|nr:2-amino-4-hydroxy-6-hydroxymethyldihydropteridine diphosphokinase [Hoylesella timonensis]KGI23094.1 2-amino-4-hydroxy-6-hydroxymethyldihydropteridine pyrophosphokinase [Hoylesella timonensis S9-PR14]
MSDKQKLLIALGTNVNQKQNIQKAMDLLRKTWHDILFTNMKWTKPIGMDSDLFYNCLAYAKVDEDLPQVQQILKNIEKACGNTEADRVLQKIQMDIDILMFGTRKLHEQDWQRSYIQELIQEIDY